MTTGDTPDIPDYFGFKFYDFVLVAMLALVLLNQVGHMAFHTKLVVQCAIRFHQEVVFQSL